jgi:hypothetical protein
MAHPMTLPALAGLSIVGMALGVHLGRSAVAEINPAYFSDPEVPFHADMVPGGTPDWAQVQLSEYQKTGLVQGLGTGCIGCRDYPIDYVPEADPTIDGPSDGYEDGWSASSGEPVHAVMVEEAEVDPAREQIERYSSYPLVEEAPAEETQLAAVEGL